MSVSTEDQAITLLQQQVQSLQQQINQIQTRSVTPTNVYPAYDLPLLDPGTSDTMVGIDEANNALRRFPLSKLPLTDVQQAALDIVTAGQKSNQISFGTWVELSAVTGAVTGQMAQVIGDSGWHVDPVSGTIVSNSGQYKWTGGVWQWLSADLLGNKVDKSELSELILSNSIKNALVNFLDADRNIRASLGEDSSGNLEFLGDDWSIGGAGVETRQAKIVAGANDAVFQILDADRNVLLGVGADGKIYGATDINSGSESSDTDIVAQLQGKALALSVGESAPVVLNNAVADKKLNVIIFYGQSNSVGADTAYALSTTQMFGNLMLGNSPRGSNYSSGDTTYDYGAVGGNNLEPLVEVVQGTTWGETVVSGTVNTLKLLHNKRVMLSNDEDRIFAGGSAGVSGATIEKLSPAANESWGRFMSMLAGFKSAADAAGYTIGSCGIVYIQGEADNAQTYDYFYAALDALWTAMVAEIKSAFGQDTNAHMVLTQYGGMFAHDETNHASAIAITDFCENHADVSFAGCHHQYPGPGAHIASNSYRWLGANIAKALNKALCGAKQPTFRITSIKHSGDKIYVAAKVPVPPITFKTAYDDWTPVDYADKGFTVNDGVGTLSGSDLTVEVVEPCVIRITCSRELSGTVRVTLGDSANHAGVHNVADSDPSVAPFVWEYNAGTTQPTEENISDLIGNPYPLHNWCARDSIISEEF